MTGAAGPPLTLDRILDPLVARLSAALGATIRVGDVAPAALGDLPCVVLSLDDAEQALVGLGRLPRGTRTGALRLSTTVDLADPVLDLGNGETLQLLSSDRRTLTLPNGPLVRADGTTDLPFGAADVSADDGAPFTVVPANPTGRQVAVDPEAGTLRFGAALAGTGQLRVTYHVGQWDTATARVQGTLVAQVSATSATAVSTTARDVARALTALDPTTRIVPSSWGAVLPSVLGTDPVRSQALGFRLDAELEEPVLATSGGVIARVSVTGLLPDPARPGSQPDELEPFDVT